MKVIDINSTEPHKSSEVICVKCHFRWYAVRHIDTFLKQLECKNCGPGYVIETGEDMRVRFDDSGIARINEILKIDPLI